MDVAQRAAWEEVGVFVVRAALSPSAVAELNALLDARLGEAAGWPSLSRRCGCLGSGTRRG